MEQDTHPEQMKRYHALLRGMTPARRLAKAGALSIGVRKMAEAGIRHRYPGISAFDVRARLTVRLYGREVAERLLGSVPDDAV